MRSKLYLLIFLFSVSIAKVLAYTSPGTSQKLTLDNLVSLSGGEVTYAGDSYQVNADIIISTTDTLFIGTNAIVKFGTTKTLTINGVLIINPPTGVIFTAQNTANAYNGVNLVFSNASVIRKLTFEYAVSFKLTDSSPIIDSCVFQFNNNGSSTTFGSSALSLFRANPTITYCKFINNRRGAIAGGGNITNTPKIYYCEFKDNNTSTTSSLPHITLGGCGSLTDTCKIMSNQFLGGSIYSGAIAIFPVGPNSYVKISGNLIKKNRYGIVLQGGSAINALVSYNVIDSNNIQGDPLLGGSGINFAGGSSTSHQNSVVTGNLIRWNLWGITVSPGGTGGAKPNLGDLTNADTTDDGKNQFINNFNNSSTPQIDFYNNNLEDVMAQGNYWGTNDPTQVEAKIFHKPDNSALGLVNYTSFIVLPVELLTFKAIGSRDKVTLVWETATEINSDRFEIERSENGQSFASIASVAAAGNNTSNRLYSLIDGNISATKTVIYYRIKMIDKDGRAKYSKTVSVKLKDKATALDIVVYPTIVSNPVTVYADVISEHTENIKVDVYDANGKLLASMTKGVLKGYNKITLDLDSKHFTGNLYLVFRSKDHRKTITILKTDQ